MKEEKTYKEIELRSEEAQEVMNRIPPAILRYGIAVMLGIVVLLLAGSAVFSYPDTVSTEFTLTTQIPPAYLPSKEGGRIEHIYVTNRQTVRKGDYIAVMESTARTEDVLYLRERVEAWERDGSKPEKIGQLLATHGMPRLGSIQSTYSVCLTAWGNYLQHMQESRLYETEVLNAVALLCTALAEWASTSLLIAPIDGTVAFMQPWKDNQLTTAGETVFVIVPTEDSAPIGKALLPMQGAGKVRVGQRALIRLEGFPEQEYGFLEGKVTSISPVPDEGGNFVVEITPTQGLKTHYGKVLPVMKVMMGTAEIVTEERSLLERLMEF